METKAAMNNDRRKTLDALSKEAIGYAKELGELITQTNHYIVHINEKVQEMRDNLQGQIEEVRDEEQDYYDNMPESLQGGEKGERANEIIEKLNEAISYIEGLDDIEELNEIEVEAEVADALTDAAV